MTYCLKSIACVLGLSFACGPALAVNNNPEKQFTAETRGKVAEASLNKLRDLEQQRKEVQRKAAVVRRQERIAFAQLQKVKDKLNDTTQKLTHSNTQLHKTERHIQQCEQNITRTRSQEEDLASDACARLRQIYEGQRMGLLEMAFQVSSLQHLLDLFYYQERIAAMDRVLLANLRQRASALAAKKDQLGSQKNYLGDMVSEFAQKALRLKSEKDEKAEVAEGLRKQRAFYEQMEQQLAQESLQLEKQIVSMTSGKSHAKATQGSGTMCMPLRASVTSPFGWRRHPIFGVKKFHTGVDLAGPNHSPIKAADSGSVLYSGWYGGYGKVVILNHGKGRATLYAHLSKAAVSPGQNVNKGDVIAYEGTTGFSTGPHLHFEVRIDGKPNNPLNFVR